MTAGGVRFDNEALDELARAFARGDESAFEALQAQVRDRLYRLAYRITGRRDDALDVVQDALFKVYRDIGAWNERSAFYSWLYRVTTNLAIDRLRRRRRRTVLQQRIAERSSRRPRPGAEHEAVVDARHDDAVRLAQLRRAVDRLAPQQRAVVALRHYEGLPLAEIARIRGCALGTVKSTLHQALRNLQRMLAAERRSEGGGHGGA